MQVVAAVIFRESQTGPEILLFQRLESDVGGGHWEFPGGKVENTESLAVALIREIQEELGVLGKILQPLGSGIHHYPERSIELHLFLYELDSWNLRLTDHQALVWLKESEIGQVKWAAADIPWIPRVFEVLKVRGKPARQV